MSDYDFDEDEVTFEETIEHLEEMDEPHPHVSEYARVALQKGEGMGMLSSMRFFADAADDPKDGIREIAEKGTDLERDIWEIGFHGVNTSRLDSHMEEIAEEVLS